MFSSDRHHDNVDCNWDLERKHLELAKERDAIIIDYGDLFCAMQGKYDKRSDLSKLRPEHKFTNYLDRLVDTAHEFYQPYQNLFGIIGRGNHESSIYTRHGTDLIDRLTGKMRSDGATVYSGGYGGWVILTFHQAHYRGNKKIKYYHGSGGGGPVTRGVIQTNRQAVYLPDADFVLGGNTHDAWYVPIARERINNSLCVVQDVVHYIRTPGYKNEYQQGDGGWWIESGKSPRPMGCAWAHLQWDATAHRVNTDSDCIVIDVK